MANISLAPDCPARILMLIMKAMSVQKPAHMILKPLNLNGAVSERTHAAARKQKLWSKLKETRVIN
jgi:hypothetical protein